MDINQDGWLDIYVSSRFYLNRGVSEDGLLKFEEDRMGLEERFDEGSKLVDWNRDGIWDILENHPSEGPVLFEGDGETYRRVALPSIPEGERGSSWGLSVCDVNQDGWSDFD